MSEQTASHLDPRLQRIAAQVRPGAVFADIGCDHGLLSIELVRQGAQKGYACDIKPGPLQAAQKNIERAGFTDLLQTRLTDGLDGLAASTSFSYLLCFGVLLLLQSGGEEMRLLCLCAAGALGGYLVFNTNKASVFMGDTGSLSLGGLIAAVSVFSGNLLYIAIIGIMFVLSSISVILQVIYYKKTKRRIFLMAPLHHHFQMKGYSESKITFVYSAITAAMGLLCLCFV